MATEIQWTDESWNPVTGCDKVSPGCAHCYAERVAIRLWPSQYPTIDSIAPNRCGTLIQTSRPRQFTDVQCHENRLDQPLRWKKPRKVFVNSMSDLFHEDVPDAFIDRVFAVMALAPQHTFQILTKRAERMRAYLSDASRRVCKLDGSSDSAHRERIGNAVPPDAAEAVASVMGQTLLLAWSGKTSMLTAAPIWVQPIVVAISLDLPLEGAPS